MANENYVVGEGVTGFQKVDALNGFSVGGTQVVSSTGKVSAAGLVMTNNGTVTGSAGAATLSKYSGVVTTETLTTAASTASTYTITNTLVAATDIVLVNVSTSGTGAPVVSSVIPGSGSFTVSILNASTSAALNAAVKIYFTVIKTA